MNGHDELKAEIERLDRLQRRLMIVFVILFVLAGASFLVAAFARIMIFVSS
jgi:hypothetical protein